MTPLVIDYFLGWNPSLATLGRAMIALSLLEREASGAGNTNINPGGRTGVKSNWIRFVVHKLLTEWKDTSRLDDNKIQFITFNYDLSLETSLQRALRAANFLKDEDITAFLAPRVLHMYGALEPVTVGNEGLNALRQVDASTISNVYAVNALLNTALKASDKLRVIDPHTKILGPESEQACKLLSLADQVYFLGFGFDPNNVKRLGLPSSAARNPMIYFTNLDDTMTVNKRFAAALDKPAYVNPGTHVGYGAEKSIRDCYDAIALDFGALD